jgi:hypothetical protein
MCFHLMWQPQHMFSWITFKAKVIQKKILHNYMAHFQEKQYKICLYTFLETLIMFLVDFAKNTFQKFDEVQ